MKKVFTVLGFIVAAGFALPFLAWFSITVCIGVGNVYHAYVDRYTVTGEVTGVGSKLKLGTAEGEKYGVSLKTKTGPTVVNCDSTQCSALVSGQQVELSCFHESNWPEPMEEECRFVGLAK